LAVLVLLTSFGPSVCAGVVADKKEAPKPLPPAVVKAWSDAGAEVGWMKDLPPQPTGGYAYWEPFREKAEPGAMPAFRFHPADEEVLAKLPDPGVAFGLDFHCSAVTGVWLKKLAGLKSLRSLNVGGSLVLTDECLKELAGLKDLQGLYLFYTHVTDAGLKELAGLKGLQALDLSDTKVSEAGCKQLAGLKSLRALNLGETRVTDAGLIGLAGLKSLQWVNLHRTRVTATGVAALQKELPACNIALAAADPECTKWPREWQSPWNNVPAGCRVPRSSSSSRLSVIGGRSLRARWRSPVT
jgi:hypothetical protein